jgi:hypothetical protein
MLVHLAVWRQWHGDGAQNRDFGKCQLERADGRKCRAIGGFGQDCVDPAFLACCETQHVGAMQMQHGQHQIES